MVLWASDTLRIATPETNGYVATWLDEPKRAKTESVFEIVPNIDMDIEGGRHFDFWDVKPG
jgi:hypothetical protein